MNNDRSTWQRLCENIRQENEAERSTGASPKLMDRPFAAMRFLAHEIDELRAIAAVSATGMGVVEADNARLVGLLEDTILPMAKDLKEFRARLDALEDIVDDLQHGKDT